MVTLSLTSINHMFDMQNLHTFKLRDARDNEKVMHGTL